MTVKLVCIIDVYGRKHRVSQADLNNPDKIMLIRYNQYGKRILDSRDSINPVIHRDNILRVT